jgi:phosphoketolase
MAERPPRWLSIPLILTSHTWENGKNEQSHQDPSLAEALLGELSPVSRVVLPADFNTADAATGGVYQTRGQIWTVVVPKADHVPDLFAGDEAARLLADGGLRLDWAGHAASRARVALVAVGAYQLGEVLAGISSLGSAPSGPQSAAATITPSPTLRPPSAPPGDFGSPPPDT